MEEMLTRAVDGFSELAGRAQKIKQEEENMHRFSQLIIHVRDFLLHLQPPPVASPEELGYMLQKLEPDIKKALQLLSDYNSGSSLRRLLITPSVLSKLNKLSKDMAAIFRLLPFSHLTAAIDSKTTLVAIIHELETMELKLAANTAAIISEIDRSMFSNRRRQDATTVELLQRIADATGASHSIADLRSEIELLKTEDEELESRKQHKEAFQLSQLIQWLESSVTTASPSPRASTDDETFSPPSSSFVHLLTGEVMEDPVSVSCGHSFERSAIEEHLRRGNHWCPECNGHLSPAEKLVPNIWLRSCIEEWKQRNAQRKIRLASVRLSSGHMAAVNGALGELLVVMTEMPGCMSDAKELKLISNLATLLKASSADMEKVLRCFSSSHAFRMRTRKPWGRVE